MSWQRFTVAKPVVLSGIGLFTARPSKVTVHPAEAGTGIVFWRADLAGSPAIPAHVSAVAELPGVPAGFQARNTTVAAGPAHPGVFVTTTEHVMSALAGMGVSDVVIEVEGPEIPILDGSALPFVAALREAGLRKIASAKDEPVLPREITVSAGAASITATPRAEPGCRLEYRLDYGPGAPIVAQSAAVELGTSGGGALRYAEDVAPARTFCLLAEAKALRAVGLFAHVTPREMVVVGDDGRPVENEWRMEDEPARHKLLDLVGDLALAGVWPRATIVATRSGHALNQAMARELVKAIV